jgi:hypothetical protein
MKRGVKDTHIYFPVKVLAELKKLAAVNRRSVSAEIVVAVEDYIKERYANELETNGTRKKERSR